MDLGAAGAAADDLADAAMRLRAAATWQLPEAELVQVCARVTRLRAHVEAAHLALVAQVEQRRVASVESVSGSRVATSTEGFLRTTACVSAGEAARDVAAARAVGPEGPLTALGDQLARGAVSRAHVDVAVRCLDRLPVGLRSTPEQQRALSDFFVRLAPLGPVRDLERAAAALRLRLDPDGGPSFDPLSDQRRFCDISTDPSGMVIGRFQLDPVAGAVLRAAVDAHAGPLPATGSGREVDTRTPRQRRADALWTVAELALGQAPARRGERPRVVVTATPDDLVRAEQRRHGAVRESARTDAGEPLDPASARRLACDAVIHLLLAAPGARRVLDLGRDERFASPTQRRALAHRDRGCVIPGCGAQPDWCDAHHVVHWADGGSTDLSNLADLQHVPLSGATDRIAS